MARVEWTEDGEDATVPVGTLAPASPYGLHNGYPCDKEHCKPYRSGQTYRHANGFRHAFKEPKPKGRPVDKGREYRRARQALQDALRKARGDKEPYPAPVLVRHKVPSLVVYSKTPWAWTMDRKGRPKPQGA